MQQLSGPAAVPVGPKRDRSDRARRTDMRAVRVARYGGDERLELVDVAAPRPGPGTVLVRLAFAGVNYMDVYMRSGAYARSRTYPTSLPMVLGMEGAGRVCALGPDVDGLVEGQRVAYCLAPGSYAEYAVVPAWRLVAVPPDVPLAVAAALMLQGSTAHYLSHSTFALQPGHTCLVHAGAGGVGQLLTQLAKLRGATVITTVGDDRKAELARSRGADHCVLYRTEDFSERVLELTDGKGADVVYDSVGRDTIARSIRCLRRRGLCVLFGASSGRVTAVDPLALAEAGSVYFTRPHLADYMASAEEVRRRAGDLFELVAAGRLAVTVDRELALPDAAEAHALLERRASTGKLLLRVADGAHDA
jgi:NADPH2:quinone reductase